ncbi:helix-turn-helix domain-containing protein [Globicatella sanguinis]
MSFGKKIKELRKKEGLNQSQLAELLGVTTKTVSNYETKDLRPRKMEMYEKLAEIFKVNINYLLTEEESFISQAKLVYGEKGKKDAKFLVESMTGLFAGGELPEEDKDALFEAIQEAYWSAKLTNQKYKRN